jgi:hypothetical protein
MRDILDGICAKALRNSLLKRIPTELLVLIQTEARVHTEDSERTYPE